MCMHGGLICTAFCLSVWPSGWPSVTRPKVTRPKIISQQPFNLRFGQNIDVDDPKVDLEGQGHRSKVKVIRSKNRYFKSNLTISYR